MKNADKSNGLFEVEAILDKKHSYNRIMYKIKWKGYSQEEATWESLKTMKEYCKEMIEDYQSELQNQSSMGENKVQSPREKYISIASESEDVYAKSKIQANQKQKEAEESSKKKVGKKSSKKKQDQIWNNSVTSNEKQILIQSSAEGKQEDLSKSKKNLSRQSAWLQKWNTSEEKGKFSWRQGNNLRSRNLSNDKPQGQKNVLTEKVNQEAIFFKEGEFIQQKSISEDNSDGKIQRPEKNKSQSQNKIKEKIAQKPKILPNKKIVQKTKKPQKKSALKLKKMLKQAKILKQPLLSTNTRQQRRNKRQDADDTKQKKSLIYLKNIHQVIASNKRSENIKVEIQSHENIERIRLIQSESTKQIRDYVIQYTNGQIKLYNTISLFASYPLQFIEYLQSKNVFLK